MYNLNFQERRTKIRLLQGRALELEDYREELEDRGMNPYDVALALEQRRKEMELGLDVTGAIPPNPHGQKRNII